MGPVNVRYLEKRRLKDGTTAYYWICRHARKLGMVNEALGTDLGAAVARAEQLNAEYDERRATKGAVEAPAPAVGTLAWLLREIERTPEHDERPDDTRKEVELAFKVIAKSPMGRARLGDIRGRDAKALYRALAASKGVTKAYRTTKWLRFALNVAVQEGHLRGSPMHKLRLARPAPRKVYWLEEEVERAIAKADEIGRRSIGLAIRIAFDLGQRQADVIRMRWSQIEGGEVIVTQGKGGATVRIPMLPELLQALAATDRTSTAIVVSETTRRPYERFNFRHRAADMIEAAGIEGKTFGDLRRSAVVRLAVAGCSIPQIAAVTGHSYEQCEKILETYLPRTTEVARQAIRRLLAARG
jgi:integrase